MKAIRTRPLNWATATLLTCLLGGLMATTLRAQLGGLGGVTLGGGSSTTASTSSSASYRGRAAVATGVVLGTGVSFSDTGWLDSSGGAKETSALQANLYGMVAAEACHAVTVGQDNMAYSEASAGQAGLNTCMTVLIGGNVITADFIMARAMASCCTSASLSGSSEIAGLTVNGQAVVVTGQPNQTVDFGNGDRIIINEQIASQTDTTADITVNALHIALCEGANVVISSAFAGITCGSTTTGGTPPGGSQPPECDFVTGGGWITGTPN